MKEQRTLLYTDSRKKAEFQNELEATQNGANDLVHVFHNFQDYLKIKSQADFETLIADPLAMFDKTLQSNSGIDLKGSGGKIPNPKVIAELYDIDRPSYISIIKGEKIEPGSCKSCGKLKIKQLGKGALKNVTYQQYKKYLIWNDNNRFEINESTVFEKLETFSYYIEDPASLEIYNYWHDLNNILNLSFKKGYLSDADLIEIAKRLKDRLLFSYQSYTLAVNDYALYAEIETKSLKN